MHRLVTFQATADMVACEHGALPARILSLVDVTAHPLVDEVLAERMKLKKRAGQHGIKLQNGDV